MKKALPEYKRIYSDINGAILSGLYKPGEQLPTEMELCKKYGVSRITIQKALKDLVDSEVITRTIGKGTFVNADRKSPTRNNVIGVLLCNISASFGTELLKSIEKNARINGYSIVFKNSDFSKSLEMEAIKEFLAMDVAGIILQPTHGEVINPAISEVILSNKPLILVDRNLSGISVPFVGSDNYMATKKVMNYLFQKGHRNISFMCSAPEKVSSIEERVEAFSSSFRDAAIPFKDYFVYRDITFTLSLIDIERKMKEEESRIKDYILSHPDITCIFTLEYSICLLVRKVLSDLGSEYQKKISLVTFDYVNDPHMRSDVAYIKQYEDEIGFQAVRLLLSAFRGSSEATSIYLPTEFVNPSLIADLTGGEK
jgi:DNA-binding LacI/PurR family transcriptional regulator